MSRKRTHGSELWMQLTPRGRKRLATLMLIQDKSQREVATAAGWTSHAYLGRLLRGEVDTLTDNAALRICHFFGVGVDDLFLVKVSNQTGPAVQHKESA